MTRWPAALVASAALLGLARAQAPAAKDKPAEAKELPPSSEENQLMEELKKTRRDYQESLKKLREFYIRQRDDERARWAEDELRDYHRMTKPAYATSHFVPGENIVATKNVPEANRLVVDAKAYKARTLGTDALDNQRRAELILQHVIDKYPESDKMPEVAYLLGDIYERYRPRPQHRLAAVFFERASQWNRAGHPDAMIRAARIYDKNLQDRGKAAELYRQIQNTDTDATRIDEARDRLRDLRGK